MSGIEPQDCVHTWFHKVHAAMQELKRKGDARIWTLGETIRVRYESGDSPFPHFDCFAEFPFPIPSRNIKWIAASYCVFQNEQRYTRQAHFIAFNKDRMVMPIADDMQFVDDYYQPLAVMLGFNEGTEISVNDEKPTITHFSEDIDYPPFNESVRDCK